MTDISRPKSATTTDVNVAAAAQTPKVGLRRPGWVVFAGAVLMLAGVSRILDAIWAFQYNRAIPDNLQGAVFGTNLTAYGILWMVVGVVLVLVGLGYLGVGWLAGSQVGRWIGIVVAGITGITAIPWMAYYPVWSLMYVAASVLIIYVLAVQPHPGAGRAE